jgi:LysM repeat protein
VESGDSFWAIAVRYNLSLDELFAFNGMNENSFLGIGDEIVIVSPTPSATLTIVPSQTPLLAETAVVPSSTPFPTPAQLMPSPTAQEIAALVATPPLKNSTPPDSGLGDVIGIGVMAFGVGLLLIAVVGVVYLRKE